jgi:uncharacterized protein YggE
MKNSLYLIVALLVLTVNPAFSQKTRTIKVEGSKSYNLSPNEIVVKIDYEEYYKGDKKIKIESLEKKILDVLIAENIKNEKITYGSISILRPYNYEAKKYEKTRLQKSIYVCIKTSEEYANLTKSFEANNLFEKVIKGFGISELRHTDKLKYDEKSRVEAFLNAKRKADLILSTSAEKTGMIINIVEKSSRSNSAPNSFYGVDNFTGSKVSGFKPIVVSYSIVVTFEIK